MNRSLPWGAMMLALVVAFVVIIAGITYRTDCGIGARLGTQSWNIEVSAVPYAWATPDVRCTSHTLARYVIGEIGIAHKI